MKKIEIDYVSLYDKILSDKNAKIVSFGISDNYVPKWNEINSLTEYIANFYDENDINFSISHTDKAVILEDESLRGIKLEDLSFGNSRSAEFTFKIGTHGEGFKLGALALIRNDKKVLIETIGYTFIFYLENEVNLNSKILKAKIIQNNRKIGTSVYLETNLINEAKNKFLFLNDNLLKINDFLYSNTSENNYIFVNTFASQQINSLFSYSLHKKQEVNRDRNMLELPYHDIAIELFSSTDKVMLRKWLIGLTNNSNLDNSFEKDLIEYYCENRKRQDFKNIDLTLIRDIIKEENISFIRYADKSKCLFLMPNSKYIYTLNEKIITFCTNILKCLSDKNQIHFSIKDGDFFLRPFNMKEINNNKNSILSMFTSFVNYKLPRLSILKNYSLTKNILKIELKNLDDIDLITGKNNNNNNYLHHTLESLMENIIMFSQNKFIIKNWETILIKKDELTIFKFKEIPEYFEIEINDKRLLQEMQCNCIFIDKKIIVQELVFSLSDKQQIFDSNYQFVCPIAVNSLYSYQENLSNYNLETIFSNKRFIKSIFSNISFPLKMEYELDLLKGFYINKAKGYVYTKNLVKAWSEQFKEMFGQKSCISFDVESDKIAKYNGYKVIQMPSILKEMFILLDIELSKEKISSNTNTQDIIHKGSIQNWNEMKLSPYYKVLYSVFLLNRLLNKIYLLVFEENQSDNKKEFIAKLLPSTLNGKLANRKASIEKYCFSIFEQTFLVSSFDNDNTNGLYINKTIFIKEKELINGSFFHEYTHLSTGLNDIDINFEKMLSFIDIVCTTLKKDINEKDIEIFFRNYLKWLK